MTDNQNEQNKKLNSILNALFLIIYGIVVLINAAGILPVSATVGNWYELFILLLSCMCISSMILKKAPQYIMLIIFLSGLYLYLHLSRTVDGFGYTRLWAMVPFFIGLAIVVSYICTKGNSGFLNFGILTMVFSSIFFYASITDTYKYVVPAIIIAVGLLSLVKAVTGIKIKILSEEDKKMEKLKKIKLIKRK